MFNTLILIIEWHNWLFDVLCLERAKMSHWIDNWDRNKCLLLGGYWQHSYFRGTTRYAVITRICLSAETIWFGFLRFVYQLKLVDLDYLDLYIGKYLVMNKMYNLLFRWQRASPYDYQHRMGSFWRQRRTGLYQNKMGWSCRCWITEFW